MARGANEGRGDIVDEFRDTTEVRLYSVGCIVFKVLFVCLLTLVE